MLGTKKGTKRMELENLYDIAQNDNIGVYAFDLKECESLSLLDSGNCFIAIDPLKIESEADEKVKLAHELGHCKTGSFYNAHSPFDVRTKHERTADKWAISNLIPENELKKACKYCRNRWELSEHFGVPEDFMQKALDFYKQ